METDLPSSQVLVEPPTTTTAAGQPSCTATASTTAAAATAADRDDKHEPSLSLTAGVINLTPLSQLDGLLCSQPGMSQQEPLFDTQTQGSLALEMQKDQEAQHKVLREQRDQFRAQEAATALRKEVGDDLQQPRATADDAATPLPAAGAAGVAQGIDGVRRSPAAAAAAAAGAGGEQALAT